MLFSNLKVKSINFITTIEQVIQIEEIGTISILLASSDNIKLHNVVLAPRCDSNLISLIQLEETRITYYDNPVAITLM